MRFRSYLSKLNFRKKKKKKKIWRKHQAPWLITIGTQKNYAIRDTLCL
uniref:Uncharacterized protein n=1 Tax=Musa acuminata subsp. malaccensis TaxID=214687 RepID=A0A804HNJ5_MUSAM